ncbi:MAG: endonuclease/exonuclease/phosphatase family protein [Verrucomicrobiota bacterium]
MSLLRLSLILASVFVSFFAQSRLDADEVIRIVAANISSGNNQSYDPGEGIRIFKGLDPDIVLIQEFNYSGNSPANFRSFVDTAFGTEFSYFREGGDEQIPNGVISRYPILQSGEWIDVQVGNRDFAWARIDIPGDKDLWAVSVHFLTSSASDRNAQATALVSFIQANIPASDYLVVGGDFNTSGFSESALGTLSSVVNTSGRPNDQNGATGTNSSRASPYDQVLPDPDLNFLETAVVINGHGFTYPDGLVFDSRVFTPLSAASPVLSGDSSASGMQHMAVVRDFQIPTGTGSTEPGAHVTNFTGTPATTSISLSWSDSVTPPGANGYLIKASTNPSITAPIDGVPETPDTDLSDGGATLLIPGGQQAAAFTGLPAATTYHFKIYPYSSGTSINYKTNDPVPSLAVTTLTDTGPLPAAPVLGPTYYPHSAGFTITWNQVPDATDYRLDVSGSPTFSGGSSTLLSENFDASSVVPATWTDGGTANDTVASHYRSASNCRALGSADTLITPAVDFPSNLSFYVDSSGAGNGKTATLSYSVNNGTWLPLSSFAVSETLTLKTISLTSSPKLDDVSNVRFRFESSFNTWYLDDVSVTSTGAPAFVNGYQNLSVGNNSHHAVSGLDPATTYYFRVRAVNLAGASPDSGTGNKATRSTGSPYAVWASDHGIAPASFTSDFDNDSLSDFEEYLFATDPKQPGSQAGQLQLSTENGGFQVTFRRSLAPGIVWTHQGSANLSAIATNLIQGSGYAQYQIVSVVRMGDYEEVVITINKADDPTFFYRIKAVESP